MTDCTVRLAGPEDQETYDGFVAGNIKGHFCQSWAWGDLKATTGWEPLRLLAFRKDRPAGALGVLKRRIPKTPFSIFYAPRGPVADPGDTEVMDALWEACRKLAGTHRAIMLEIDPDIPESNREYIEYFEKCGFKKSGTGEGFEGTQPRYVFRLDIRPTEDELFAAMHPKTRYNIRYAVKKGVTIREMTDRQELDAFYEILKETADRDGFLIRSRQYYFDIWDRMVPRGEAVFFMADFGGAPIAGTLAMFCGDKCWYLYGASSNAHRNVMPNYLIQWHMIREAKARGCTLYDFRGVPGELTEDNPLYGLYRFKKGFAGEFTGFMGQYVLVYRPLLYRLWNVAEPLYYKGIRRLIRLRRRWRDKN